MIYLFEFCIIPKTPFVIAMNNVFCHPERSEGSFHLGDCKILHYVQDDILFVYCGADIA